MEAEHAKSSTGRPGVLAARFPAFEAPFIRAPEEARTVYLVTLAAACGPLLAGAILFGWRALVVAAISLASCAFIERLYYRVTRVPALLGRSHAYLTGMLLALTLPPFAPWYVPIVAAAFAIIVGKAIFGGVGHFLWQPALVGRLAVAVMFPAVLNPPAWPLLARNKVLYGDVTRTRPVEHYVGWRRQPLPAGGDAYRLVPPRQVLAGLTRTAEPQFSGMHAPAPMDRARPAALLSVPPLQDLLFGARPGGVGETCCVAIVVAGLYLIYRNYVKWQLPLSMLLAAGCVAAVAPIRFAAPNQTQRLIWLPLTHEGLQVGFAYVNYQLFSGELLLATLFLATEMTSRPVTTGGQVIFALACGAAAMALQLYVDTPIPAYMAVLAMNSFTPLIDRLWRPRVFGMRLFRFRARR